MNVHVSYKVCFFFTDFEANCVDKFWRLCNKIKYLYHSIDKRNTMTQCWESEKERQVRALLWPGFVSSYNYHYLIKCSEYWAGSDPVEYAALILQASFNFVRLNLSRVIFVFFTSIATQLSYFLELFHNLYPLSLYFLAYAIFNHFPPITFLPQIEKAKTRNLAFVLKVASNNKKENN